MPDEIDSARNDTDNLIQEEKKNDGEIKIPNFKMPIQELQSNILLERGKRIDCFYLILQGNVLIRSGVENFGI